MSAQDITEGFLAPLGMTAGKTEAAKKERFFVTAFLRMTTGRVTADGGEQARW